MYTLTIVTPEKRLVAGQEIEEVFVPGYRGELNVLPGHAPLLTTLATGVVKYRLKGENKLHYVAVSGGYCQVQPEGVNVLAETAEGSTEIDLELAEQAVKTIGHRLATEELDPSEVKKLQDELGRASAQIAAVSGGNA